MAGSLSAVRARLRLAVALATSTPLSEVFPAECHGYTHRWTTGQVSATTPQSRLLP